MTSPVPTREEFLDALAEDDPVLLYEQAPCGFLSTTPDGLIVKVNATLCSWLGTTADQLVGRRSFVDLLTPGGRIYHETHYGPMLRMQHRVRELALELRCDDGGRLPVLINATLDLDAAGQPHATRVAVFDARERRRYERELLAAKERAESSEARARELVRTLQQTLIPPTEPQVPGLQVATAYRPGTDGLLVGGDFYDVFPIGTDDWGLLLGDVSGKGAEAAVVTALARWTVRAAMVAFDEPSRALANLNDVLRDHETDRFCTAVAVRLRRDGIRWRARLSVGGHPAPIRIDANGDHAQVRASGPLVGVLETTAFVDEEIELGPGDGLLLFTDGITEARNGQTFFEEAGILASLRDHDLEPRHLIDGLLDNVARFRTDGTAIDDVAVLALRVPPLPT